MEGRENQHETKMLIYLGITIPPSFTQFAEVLFLSATIYFELVSHRNNLRHTCG